MARFTPAERQRLIAHMRGLEPAARDAQQLLDALDAVGFQAQRGQHRGLVARAGAHFQHPLRDAVFNQRGGHARHHPGLGDGLAVADRQRGVLVGAARQRLVQEQVARHGAHRGEHALVADAALGAQALDHAVAGALRGHAQALCLGLEVEAWGHAPPFMLSPRPPTQLATFSSAW